MTKDFEIISEQIISLENKPESTFVNVGWGSYETQFKGSVGKKESKEEVCNFLLIWLFDLANEFSERKIFIE
jgi:hypothetical protein